MRGVRPWGVGHRAERRVIDVGPDASLDEGFARRAPIVVSRGLIPRVVQQFQVEPAVVFDGVGVGQRAAQDEADRIPRRPVQEEPRPRCAPQ